MAKATCPECRTEGTEHIVSEPSQVQNTAGRPWFDVAYCDGCGHIYGVFAKQVYAAELSAPLVVLAVPQV